LSNLFTHILQISNIITKGSKAVESPSALSHPEETGSEQTSLEEPAKIISQHEYIAKVHELRDGINSAWQAEDRVTSLKLSIKVTKLLMDTTVLRFYPTVFVIVTDMLDMLGDMVWERIKQKAELDIDGTVICALPSMHFYSNRVFLSNKIIFSPEHSVLENKIM
jgi:hypothetical protein